MKIIKILLMLFTLFNFSLSALAEYKPIPQNLKSAYKKEMEYIIKTEVPKSKKAIKNIKQEFIEEKNITVKQTILDYGITSVLFDFYLKLIYTTEKFTSIKQEIPATDWYIELKEFINPYLIDNSIKTKDINSLLNYAEKKQKELKNL